MSTLISTTHAAASIPTFLELQVSPNPVGVGQQIYMQCFLSKPISTASMNGVGDHYTGITISITAPGGATTKLGPFTADPTGGIPSLEYTPTTTGVYTFQASYPGQTLTTAGAYFGLIEKPSVSEQVNITVQETPIQSIGSSPLPTSYWDFPIYATNYGWSSLEGNWLGLMPA